MAELCREFGISRKTGYKIFDRYQECGVQGLTDRSQRPYRYGPLSGKSGWSRKPAKPSRGVFAQQDRAPDGRGRARGKENPVVMSPPLGK
jgi:hypothetical protein